MSASKSNGSDWDQGVPAVALCARCGLPGCAGCIEETRAVESLAWEQGNGFWLVRSWRTALEVSLEPEHRLGRLQGGPLGRALGFAVVVESLALGSVAVVVALLMGWVAPELWARSIGTAKGLAVGTALLGGSVFAMLLLHAVWGVALAGGVTVAGAARFSTGLRFGFYACGWDLVTSPIGMVMALATRGPLAVWRALNAAVRAPRLAQGSYLEFIHGASRASRERALRRAACAVGLVLLLLCAGAVAALAVAARRLGY